MPGSWLNVKPSQGCIVRGVGVRRDAHHVVLGIALRAVVEDAGAAADDQVAVAAASPREVDARHPEEAPVVDQAVGHVTRGCVLDTVGALVAAVEEDALARVVLRRVEDRGEAVDLGVVRHVGHADAGFEVKLRLIFQLSCAKPA
jgi:hypothetical protein